VKRLLAGIILSVSLIGSPVIADSRDLSDIYADTEAAIALLAQTNGVSPQGREDITRLSEEGIAFIDGMEIPDCGREAILAMREMWYFLERGITVMEAHEDAVRRADTALIDVLGAEVNLVIPAGVSIFYEMPTLLAEVDC
jgi:hypothetical protein